MKKLIVLACVLCCATAVQAKEISKEQWLQKQEQKMQKAGKQFNSAKAEKRWNKIDINGDNMLDDAEKAEAKKAKKAK